MYLPQAFAVTDPATLHAFVRQHPLATWATVVHGELVVNHLPLRVEPAAAGSPDVLVGHVARANPVWQAPGPSVFVFHGPSAYISPSYYPGKRVHGKVVPTWNYAVVHAHGTPQVIDDPAALRALVTHQTDSHEASLPAPGRWTTRRRTSSTPCSAPSSASAFR